MNGLRSSRGPLAVGLVSLFGIAQGAYAECVEGAISIEALPATLTSVEASGPTYYCLADDFTIAADRLGINDGDLRHALLIDASRVNDEQSIVLDLNGKTIQLTGDATLSTGIEAYFGSDDFRASQGSVAVMNGTMIGFDYGVYASSVEGGTFSLDNIGIASDPGQNGVYVSSFDALTLQSLTLVSESAEGSGIQAWDNTNVIVDGVAVSGYGFGAYIARTDKATVRNGSSFDGLQASWTTGVEFYSVGQAAVANVSVSGYATGIDFENSNGVYARTTVSGTDAAKCVEGGKSLGNANQCL